MASRIALYVALLAGCGGGPTVNQKAHGTVAVTSGGLTVGGQRSGPTTASADFFSDETGSGSITIEPLGGGCQLVTVTSSMGMQIPQSAGVITVAGGTKMVTLDPDTGARYPVYMDPAPLWSGGETITVSAAGDPTGTAVPAFSTKVTAPSSVDFTQPPPPAQGAPLAVDRSRDLAVAWGGGTAGVVRFTIDIRSAHMDSDAGVVSKQASVSLDCTFPATAGHGTIAASALQRLPAGAQGQLDLGGGGLYSDVVTAGIYTVQVEVLSAATWAGQAIPATLVTVD